MHGDRRWLGIAALALLAGGCPSKQVDKGAAGSAGPAPSGATIKVGEYGSLTGATATFGVSTRDGVELARKELNAAGGVLGKQFEVIVYDDQGKQQEAATAVTKLITQDKVMAVLGEVASSLSLAAGPIAQRHGVPMISPSSTNPKVTEVGDMIFRVCFLDPFQGEVMAKFAWNTLKAKKVAVFKDQANAYSVGLAEFFEKTFTKLGGKVVAQQAYSAGDNDFKSQLTNIRGASPDAIFVPGYYTEVGLIARQAKAVGLKVPLLGGDGWDSSKLTEIGGDAIEGSYFSNHYSVENQEPHVQRFIAAYEAAFKAKPDGLAALGYDAMMILADAIKRAGSDDPRKVRDALAATKGFKGVTGMITIDENRNAKKSAVVLKIMSAGFKYQETIAAD